MKLHLACHGGLANLRLEGELDTDELAPTLAQKAVATLEPKKLADAEATARDPLVADDQQIVLTLLPEKSGDLARKYRLDESSLSDDLLEILDELRHALVRKRAKAAGR